MPVAGALASGPCALPPVSRVRGALRPLAARRARLPSPPLAMTNDFRSPAGRDAQVDDAPRPTAQFTWCADCKAAIRSHYYAMNGRPVCAKCKPQYSAAMVRGEGPGSLARTLAYGIGAAIVGTLLIALANGFFFMARIPLFVGVAWIITRAIVAATGDYYMRRYQVLAVVLIYLAIGSGALVPTVREMVSWEPPPPAAVVEAEEETDELVVEEPAYASEADSMIAVVDGMKAERDEARANRALGADRLEGRQLAEMGLPQRVFRLAVMLVLLPIVGMLSYGIYGAVLGMFGLGFGLRFAWRRIEQGVTYAVSGPHKVGTGPIPQVN